MPFTKNSSSIPIVCGFSPAINNYSPPTNNVISKPATVNYDFNLVLLHLAQEYILPLTFRKNLPRFDNYISEEQYISLFGNSENDAFPSTSIKITLQHFNQIPLLTPRRQQQQWTTAQLMAQFINPSTDLICFGLDLSDGNISEILKNILEKQKEIETELNRFKPQYAKQSFHHKYAIICHHSTPNLLTNNEISLVEFAKTNKIDYVLNNISVEEMVAIATEVVMTEKALKTLQHIQQAHSSPETPRQLTPRGSSRGGASLALTTLSLNGENKLPDEVSIIELLVNQRVSINKEEWKKIKNVIVSAVVAAPTIAEKRRLVSEYKTALQMHFDEDGEGSFWCRWFNSNESKSWREVKAFDPNPNPNPPPQDIPQEKPASNRCIIS